MPNCNTIAICNQKGGVGKTTTTVNLGVGLAMQGKKVLLVDADPQGDLTTCLGWKDTDNLPVALPDKMVEVMQDKCKEPMKGILHHKEGVDLIPSNSDLFDFEISLVTAMNREAILRNYLNEVKHNYDYIIIDCSPSLGMMTLNALSAADSVIIPVQAHYLPAKCMTQLMRTITKVKKHINPKLNIDGILLTLVDNRTNLAKSTIDALRENFGSYIMLAIFCGLAIWFHVSQNDAIIIGRILVIFAAVAFVLALYRAVFFKVLIDKEGFFYQTAPGNGRYYHYYEIRKMWISSGNETNSQQMTYCNFETNEGKISRFFFMGVNLDAVDYLMKRVEAVETTDSSGATDDGRDLVISGKVQGGIRIAVVVFILAILLLLAKSLAEQGLPPIMGALATLNALEIHKKSFSFFLFHLFPDAR